MNKEEAFYFVLEEAAILPLPRQKYCPYGQHNLPATNEYFGNSRERNGGIIFSSYCRKCMQAYNSSRRGKKKDKRKNRKYTRLLTCGEKTQTLTEWATELNISPHTIIARLRYGATDIEALRKDKRPNRIMLTLENKTQDVLSWAKEISISTETIRWRLRQGATHEKALQPNQKKRTPLRLL